jgi:hypothetical protein
MVFGKEKACMTNSTVLSMKAAAACTALKRWLPHACKSAAHVQRPHGGSGATNGLSRDTHVLRCARQTCARSGGRTGSAAWWPPYAQRYPARAPGSASCPTGPSRCSPCGPRRSAWSHCAPAAPPSPAREQPLPWSLRLARRSAPRWRAHAPNGAFGLARPRALCPGAPFAERIGTGMANLLSCFIRALHAIRAAMAHGGVCLVARCHLCPRGECAGMQIVTMSERGAFALQADLRARMSC